MAANTVEECPVRGPGDQEVKTWRVLRLRDLKMQADIDSLLQGPGPRALWIDADSVLGYRTGEVAQYEYANEFVGIVVGAIIDMASDRCSDCGKAMSRKTGGCFNSEGDDDCDGTRVEMPKIDWLHVYSSRPLEGLRVWRESWWYLQQVVHILGIAFSSEFGEVS